MRIGLDIDGVIYPWHYSIYRYFTEFKNFAGSELEFWAYFRLFSVEKQMYYVSIPTLYTDTSLTQDAIEYLPKLAELGELFYITSRDHELQPLTQKFFKFYDIPFKENLIFEKDKASVVRLYGIDYFVDDMISHLEKMQGITTSFLFKQPHNFYDRDGYNCIGSLKEFYNTIQEKQ